MNLSEFTSRYLHISVAGFQPCESQQGASAAFLDSDNRRYLSAASAWEIAAKYALGRLPLPAQPEVHVPRIRRLGDIESLAVDEESALYAGRLPKIHADPFDRILVAQAVLRNMVILTPDEAIAQCGGRVIW